MTTTPETTSTQRDGLREQVRARYGEFALDDQRGCGCAPSCCPPGGGNPAATGARTLGYSAEDLASAPEGSDLG